MSPSTQPKAQTRGVAELLDSLVASDGTGAHPHVRSGALSSGPEAMRNLADAVHFLCLLHGRYPGVIDNAARKAVDPASRQWMDEAAGAFAEERAFLSKIASAVGPVPSTQGQAQCEAAVAAQRKAIDMLAESDRQGCAVGAAIAALAESACVASLAIAMTGIPAEAIVITIPRPIWPRPTTAALRTSRTGVSLGKSGIRATARSAANTCRSSFDCGLATASLQI